MENTCADQSFGLLLTFQARLVDRQRQGQTGRDSLNKIRLKTRLNKFHDAILIHYLRRNSIKIFISSE